MILYAPAKVNLYLKVLEKRPDGYHNINTVFERIALFDKIILRSLKKNEIKIFCDNPGVPTDKASLIYRTVDLLRRKANTPKGAEVKILKKIPIAAGLAGGSSDAASVLMGLNKLWGLSLALSRLLELGKSLGADIPFFMKNTSFALGEKRGDEITPLTWKKTKFWHLLVYSPVKVLSRDIYSMYSSALNTCHSRESGNPCFRRDKSMQIPAGVYPCVSRGRNDKTTLVTQSQFLYNDLERAVLKKEPVIGRVKTALKHIGIKSLVSGSGPSVFSIFGKRKEAVEAKKTLIRRFPFVNNKGWQIFVVPTV